MHKNNHFFESKLWNAAGLFFAVFLLSACMHTTVYHSYVPVSSDGWNKADTFLYNLPKTSSADAYTIDVGVRTTDRYKYRSLWLVVEQDLLKKGQFKRDTLNCPISNEDGVMLGKGFCAYQQEIPLRSISTGPGGGHTVKIFHIMRSETLYGIWDVGINVSSNSLQHQFVEK